MLMRRVATLCLGSEHHASYEVTENRAKAGCGKGCAAGCAYSCASLRKEVEHVRRHGQRMGTRARTYWWSPDAKERCSRKSCAGRGWLEARHDRQRAAPYVDLVRHHHIYP